jgi:glycosyltransferase involved in cell wall biosynthesis
MSRHSRPTVLFLTRRFWPAVGGVETHMAEVAKILKSTHDITVVTEQHESTLPLQEIHEGINIIRLPTSGTPWSKWSYWRWWLQHRQLLANADVVHIHDVFFWLQPLRPLFFFKKWFMTFHGYEPPQPTWRQRVQHQLAAWLTNGNICVGGFHQKWYGVKPNFITYGGVNASAHSSKKKSAPKQPKKIIFIGRLAEDTGIQTLLNALRNVDEKLQLDIYGDGPIRARLESQAKHFHHAIQFHGFDPNAREYLPEADIVFASQYLSILDALAAGTPVIALADTPLKKDYLELTPFAEWITIAHDEKEIASALTSTQTLNPNAPAWARSQTWLRVVENYLRLWPSR